MFKSISKFIFAHRREVVVTAATLLLFTITLLFSSQLITSWSNFSIHNQVAKVEGGGQEELRNLSLQREQIIASGIFNNALKENNPPEVLAIAQTEAKKRNLDLIVVTDKDGFVLARSGLSVEQGDNVFQTTIYGRGVAQGETVTGIFRSVRYHLVSLSSSYIFEQNKPIGSILVGQIFNTAYATRFQEKYLKQGGQIVFYTPQEGIIGDSFKDKDKTQLISAYFSLGSDFVSHNLTGLSKEIRIDSDYYAIRHIVFPGAGIEESPGGAFVFFPIRHNSYSLFLASVIILLFFVFYYLNSFLLKFLDHHKHHIRIFLWLGFILFIATYLITLIKLDRSAIELKKSPYLIYNSIIKFEPETDVVSQSSEKTIAIEVLTGGEAINAVSAIVNYDPKAAEVLDIIIANSFCDSSFFLEKEINKAKGEIRITCVMPSPGFTDAVGKVAELLVQPLDLKPISLEFTEETQVLANDGLGTNVLRAVTGGYYQVVRQKFATADIKNPISIFSPSHPNSNRWYKNKNVKLSWPSLLGGTYYYTLSRGEVSSAEDKISSTTSNYLNTSADNGIYYFHLQAKDAAGKPGPASSFKIMVDTTPPLPPKIKASSVAIKKGDIVRLDFKSEDALSGLQSGFYVKMNEGIFLPVKPPFYIPFLESGEYPIVIRAFDKANNFSDSSIVIHVSN